MPATLKIWDIWVRFTHWAVAGIVMWNLYAETGNYVHRVAGYVAAGLVAARVVWGVVGTRNARFASWWPTRAQLAAYLRALASRRRGSIKASRLLAADALQRRPLAVDDLVQRDAAVLQVALRVVREVRRRHSRHRRLRQQRQVLRRIRRVRLLHCAEERHRAVV